MTKESKKDTTKNTEKKGLTTNQKIMIGGFSALIIVIIAAVFIIIRVLNKPEPVTGGNLVVDETNLTSMSDDLRAQVEDGLFELNMNMIWHFPDGTSASSDAYVANSEVNRYAISFDILVDDEILFTSTTIPLGSQIKDITLNKDLSAGTYPAVCRYHLLREDGTENSSVDINVTLEIEN